MLPLTFAEIQEVLNKWKMLPEKEKRRPHLQIYRTVAFLDPEAIITVTSKDVWQVCLRQK